MTDLDKSGRGFQQVRTYLGPSLGWVMELVEPSRTITLAGAYQAQPGDSLLLVNTTGPVTITLPDVRQWIAQTANQPATGFTRGITIKDLGGNASSANITIKPFGTQNIDNTSASIFISTSHGVTSLVPLIDLTGWVVVTGAGGPPPSFLSSPTAAATGLTTAALSVATDTGSGTLFWVVAASSMPPTAAQIIAGQDNTGATAAASGSQIVSATGVQMATATGLAPPTNYTAYFVQVVGGSNSNIAASAIFNTVFISFGVAADRITMLHPASFDTFHPPNTNQGVVQDQVAIFVSDMTPGGTLTNQSNYVTIGSAINGPDGSLNTAKHITEGATTQTHNLVGGTVFKAGTGGGNAISYKELATKLRLSVYAKAAERTRITIGIEDTIHNRGGAFGSLNGTRATFDLANGVVAQPNTALTSAPWFTPVGQSITSKGGGWYRCDIDTIIGPYFYQETAGTFVVVGNVYLDNGTGNAATSISYTGNGTSGVFTWRGNMLPVSAWNLNSQLFFDDFLSTSTIDVNNTRVPGFNWYVDEIHSFANHSAVPLVLNTDYDVASSYINFHVSDATAAHPGFYLMSVTNDGTNSGYIGNAYQLPWLMEARFYLDPTPVSYGGSWPIFWTDGAEGIFDQGVSATWPVVPILEIDFDEWGTGSPPPSKPFFAVHAWKAPFTGNDLPGEVADFDPYPSVIPNFLVPHTFGTIVTPQASGTPAFGTGQRNILPNTSWAGAVAGTPGTMPTRMTLTGLPPGISSQIVSVGGGLFQLRLFGTAGASSTVVFDMNSGPHNNSGGTIAPGQVWTGSVTTRLAAGSDQFGMSPALVVEEYNAADVDLSENSFTAVVTLPTTSGPNRWSCTLAASNASVARLSLQFIMSITNGFTIDFTYEFSQPQLELSFLATPFQASTGSNTVGTIGTTVTQGEPYFQKYFSFFDGGHVSDNAHSTWARLRDNSTNHVLGGTGLISATQHFALILGATTHNWPTHYDWVSVIGS